MKEKKALCSLVNLTEDYDLGKLLLDGTFKETIYYKNKDIELSHISRKGDFILGMFVSTQKKDLAPIHTPGDEDDYSAVPLKNGQGLAYPNVFLYHTKKKVLLWEVNRLGVVESSMEYFFNEIAQKKGYTNFSIKLEIIMFPNAYDRINNLSLIEELEFQIANPIAYLRSQNENATLSSIARMASNFGASKSIKIIIKAEEVKTVTKQSVLSILGFIDQAPLQAGRTKNKVLVKGVKKDGDTLVEETINYITDRMFGYFLLTELKVATHLQVIERKDGIVEIYQQLADDIKALLD